MKQSSCDSCKFFQVAGDRKAESIYNGFCRKYAPRPFLWHSAEGDGFGYMPDALWPAVSNDEWCGEWSQKE